MIDNLYELEGEKYALNQRLIIQQGLSQKQVDKIKELHKERLMTEKYMETLHNREEIRSWYKVWTQIQYDLQRHWGFPENADFHPSHRLSKCICAKMDNDERLGTPYRVITVGCPIHDVKK